MSQNSKLRIHSKPDRNQSKLTDNHNYLHNNNYNHNLYYNHYNYYHNLYNHNLYYNHRFVPSIGNKQKKAGQTGTDFGSTETFCNFAKGQLISKCLFDVIAWTKIATKNCQDFCPEIFCSFLGASYQILRKPKKLPEGLRKQKKIIMKSWKKIRRHFCSKWWHQKDISNLVDL